MVSHSLKLLLQEIDGCWITHNKDIDTKIDGVSLSSKDIKPGYLFVAVNGQSAHGLQYYKQAIAQGCSAILFDAIGIEKILLDESVSYCKQKNIALASVDNLSVCLGKLASKFYQQPSAKMNIIGVTGTNGKTTCSMLIAQALEKKLGRVGYIGTLGYGLIDKLQDLDRTTPDVITNQRLLQNMLNQGVKHAVMEISSHALEQNRIDAINFTTAIFTNLTRDHLDYHGDMESYFQAKSKLFNEYSIQNAVINIDDVYGQRLVNNTKAKNILTYGTVTNTKNNPEIFAEKLQFNLNETKFLLKTPWGSQQVSSSLLGEFNVSNLLAVIACLLLMNIKLEEVIALISSISAPIGRLEKLKQEKSNQPNVFIDYAHTPDALKNVLTTLKSLTAGNLYCVFGCGGDRDQGKRKQMGEIAGAIADQVIVTNDNPRNESPEKIIKDILTGITPQTNCLVITDRVDAIHTSIQMSSNDDVVLIAGKGHEQSMYVKDGSYPFSDHEQAYVALRSIA